MKTKESIKVKKKSIQKWPKVAIIILNWNGWKDTIECLESVFKNIYPNYQVIVVDNGSTDGSMKKITEWAEGKRAVLTPEPTHPLYHLSHPSVQKPINFIEYEADYINKIFIALDYKEQKEINNFETSLKNFHPLVLIKSRNNLGFSGGNNLGIKYTLLKGNMDYILLLNNDTVIDKHTIKIFINFYMKNKNKKIGIVTGMIKEYNKPNIINYIGKKLDYRIPYKLFFRHINRNKIYLSEKLLPYYKTEFVFGTFIFISVNVLKKEKMLDEDFFFGEEDHEFCYRLIKKGYIHYLIHNAIIYHKIGSSRRFYPEQTYNSFISKSILWKKIVSKPKWWCMYIFYITYSFLLSPINYVRKRKRLKNMNLNFYLFIKLQFIIYILICTN